MLRSSNQNNRTVLKVGSYENRVARKNNSNSSRIRKPLKIPFVIDFAKINLFLPLELIIIIFRFSGPSVILLFSHINSHWRRLCKIGTFGKYNWKDIWSNVFDTADEYLLDIWIHKLRQGIFESNSRPFYKKLLDRQPSQEINEDNLFKWGEVAEINKLYLVNVWAEYGKISLLERALTSNQKTLQHLSPVAQKEFLLKKDTPLLKPWLGNTVYLFEEMMQSAASGNSGKERSVIEWGLKNIDSDLLEPKWDILACAAASDNRNIELLKNLICVKNFNCDSLVCSNLANKGEMAALEYFRSNGCEWDTATFNSAAYGGNTLMLNYCVVNKCPCDLLNVCANATRGGSLANLKFLIKNVPEISWTVDIIHASIYRNQLHILEYALQNNCPTDEYSCILAARLDNPVALKMLRDHGCPWNEKVFYEAALRGNIEILMYCHKNKCPLDKFKIYATLLSNISNYELTWYTSNVLTKDEIIQFKNLIEENPYYSHYLRYNVAI